VFAPLRSLAHALVSQPFAYDLVQRAAGSRQCYARLQNLLPNTAQLSVLDAGAGTGRSLTILDPRARYTAVDLDVQKLFRLRQKLVAVSAACADVQMLPVRSRAFDLGLLVFVCHHLDDGALAATLGELARVCSGHVFIMDPVWNPRRWRSRMLWRYDEGKHPRSSATLGLLIERTFTVDREEQFSVHHQYHIWQCRPKRGMSSR
jgi:SAM-dependent methyltransferase